MQSTAHWTAIIATIAVSLCLTIVMVALGIVVARDGNVAEVSDALAGLVKIGGGLAITLGLLVAGPQAVSAIVQRVRQIPDNTGTGGTPT